ncbi:phosphoadenylyl-sulfate reductase [Chitinimonas sp. BJB300]|uniref:phosphoadenylyl-sulfate reductase n=1 Tax=Chitinimonas sp. BJB300 TaxID=1559339 RepID=UPI000C0E319A|nr:phosphoadenylyl-sulfate reductase [Chitinimonas sp. BJB300]PHV10999.1 phosphoadenylyl-sulfate reductase [Chitinimonas sp. BJB300]TSJ87001.1 phosphoadenylyl-sulfate reductase [Chitinimonas sp. BJB300]
MENPDTGLNPALQTKLTHSLALLQHIAKEFSPAVFANSLGVEDMVLTDLIARHHIAIDIFSLDTGRLPNETYTLMQQAAEAYPAKPIKVFFPQAEAVETYVNTHGINGFYGSVDARKTCCHIRKLEPLARALAGKQAWITGLRSEQSTTRTTMQEQEWDATNGLQKFNPLLVWTEKEVWAYIKTYQVPYNALHDQHYPSIGCAPCTRAIAVGEDIRAGRWWWESPENKECGLHAKVSSLKPIK